MQRSGPAQLAPLALALACTAACGVRVDGGGGVDAATDAADAAIDAAPCTGGDAAMRSPRGACFVLFSAPVTYTAARDACAGGGARLAILRDAQDDQVARTLVGMTGTAFIGLTDVAVEGGFVWGDNSVPAYTNWYMGEPNDGGGGYPEDCAVVAGSRAGQWDDRPCAPIPDVGAGMYSYLCES